MRYCHECGSEIAEIDVFCPYCGITQIPAQGEEETAQERTVAVSQEEMADLIENKYEADEAAPITDQSGAENEFAENLAEKEKTEQPQNITSENVASDTDSIDIPAQAVPELLDKPLSEISSQTDSGGSASVAPRLYEEERKSEKETSEKAVPDDVM